MTVMNDVTQVKNDQGLADLFEVAEEKIFLPFTTEKQPNGSLKKVPHDGQYKLSYTNPSLFVTLLDARERVRQYAGLKGVGLMFTGGIVQGDWQLIGLDFDKVKGDLKRFKLPVASYADRSPSGKGIHQLAWAPVAWAAKHRYTGGIQLPGCDHAEVYLASGWLTVTGDKLNDLPINQLTEEELRLLESWNLKPYEEPKATPADLELGDGTPFALTGLKPEQRDLLAGKIPAGKGLRHPIVMSLLITLVEQGHAREDIKASVLLNDSLAAYFSKHDDPVKFATGEINKAYAKSDRGKREALAIFHEGFKKDKPVTTNPPVVNVGPPTFPMEVFHKAQGLVGEIARWIMKASRAPREEFAYATALSVVACLIGENCWSDTGKTNLYIVLIGGTGTGKNEAIDPGMLLLRATLGKGSVISYPASEAALRRQLTVTHNILIHADELAHKLDSMKNNTNGEGLSGALLEAWNGAPLDAKPYANEKNNLPAVDNPFVQILGGTTGKVWDVLESKNLGDGTLCRFLFISLPANAPYSDNPTPCLTVEKAFLDKLNAFWRQGRHDDLTGKRHVTLAPEVAKAMADLGPKLFSEMQTENGELYTKVRQNTGKVATILAVGDRRQVISMTDFEQALAFVSWSVSTTSHHVSARLAGSDLQRKTKGVIQRLKEAGGKLTWRELYRPMNMTRREMEEVVTILKLAVLVDETEEGIELLS